jgi:hypothetical protein
MREKGNRLSLRLSDRDEECIKAIIEWSGDNKITEWNRAETMRFCLRFTHILLSLMPAVIIDAILSEQVVQPIDE